MLFLPSPPRLALSSLALACLSSVAGALSAHASEELGGAALAARIGTSLRLSGDDFGVEQFELEYRFPWQGPLGFGTERLAPVVGASTTEEGATFVHVGFRYDVDLGDGWRFTPSLVAGAYDRNGGRSLGGELQFRTRLEVSARVSERLRVGISGHHISNGNLGEGNPGAEFLSAVAIWQF